MISQDKPALLLIDIQKGMDELDYFGGRRNNPNAEENALRLLTFWRQKGLPIFHIKHNSTSPDSPLVKGKIGNEFKDITQPLSDEPILEKNVNSAFIGTDLKERLDQQSIKKVVIVGLTTEHCISTSTRMAGNLGFDVFLISDATAAFDKVGPNGKKFPAELVHELELANLHQEFAQVMTVEALLKKFQA